MPELQAFLASDAGSALKLLSLATLLDLSTGIFAAIRDDTFAWDAVAAFLRKHVAGRLAPVALLLGFGYFGGAAGQPFLVFAITGAALYAAETVASVKGNVFPAPSVPQPDGPFVLSSPVNPVPTE